MRISEERQQSRIRISKVEVAISEAIDKATKPESDLTIEEIVMALVKQTQFWQNELIMAATPIEEEE